MKVCDRTLDLAAHRFTTVDVPRKDQGWRWHPWLGLTRQRRGRSMPGINQGQAAIFESDRLFPRCPGPRPSVLIVLVARRGHGVEAVNRPLVLETKDVESAVARGDPEIELPAPPNESAVRLGP
jgi:hypothetical protein